MHTSSKTILVTGSAGFIGMHLTKRLLDEGKNVVGIDNLNEYYDLNLKLTRLNVLNQYSKFTFIKMDVEDRDAVEEMFAANQFEYVVHLAAQAGVRYSVTNPKSYIDSNLVGFANILEGVRSAGVKHFIFASSSSIYGGNIKTPYCEDDRVDHPISLYAATKRANELIAYSYSHLYGIPITSARLFTVYGPWGRPDMSPFLFVDAIANERSISVFNNGNMIRDFTYIDDVVEALFRLLDKPPVTSDESPSPNVVVNVGNSSPIKLNDYIATIEKILNTKAIKKFLPMQLGDVHSTMADTTRLFSRIGFQPKTSLEDGLKKYIDWYKSYYG